MDIKKIMNRYLPMTETAFYILLSLSEPRHGHGIIRFVEELTEGRIRLGSGTVYGWLAGMARAGFLLQSVDYRKRVFAFEKGPKTDLPDRLQRGREGDHPNPEKALPGG